MLVTTLTSRMSYRDHPINTPITIISPLASAGVIVQDTLGTLHSLSIILKVHAKRLDLFQKMYGMIVNFV